jgi:hypothetical protein
MATITNLRCGEAHLDRIETQVNGAGLIQKIDRLAVLLHELARDPGYDFRLEPSGAIPGGEESKRTSWGPDSFPRQRTYILSRHES